MSVIGVWRYFNDHVEEEELPELSVLFNLRLNLMSELRLITSFSDWVKDNQKRRRELMLETRGVNLPLGFFIPH